MNCQSKALCRFVRQAAVLTLGAAACCRESAAAAALREFLPAPELFNYTTPVSGPGK